MTIAIACNLADGIVMGADSALTLSGTVETPNGTQEGILKVYNDAEKLFSLYGWPVGIVTYGVALLNHRTIQSYIREFEVKHIADSEQPWSIQQIAEEMWKFFSEKYRSQFAQVLEKRTGKTFEQIALEQRPVLGFMVGGFSPDQYLSENWDVMVQTNTMAEGVRQVRAPGNFGSDWRGETEGIVRFHKGFDFRILDAVIQRIVDAYGISLSPELLKELQGIVLHAEYQIPWDGMPLQEGVDYVKFCLGLMINQTKFVIGAPTCGGTVRIAAIRREEKFQLITDARLHVRVY